jgi:acetylornithine/N-succinyldiaminopimelate aminotransferase
MTRRAKIHRPGQRHRREHLRYADKVWAEAVTKQLNTLQHTSNLYYTEPCVKLAEMLCRRTGMAKVFFGNSGAEANEGAIKAARRYSFLKYGEGRSTIITLKNSFHGRTITTLPPPAKRSSTRSFRPLHRGLRLLHAG